MLRFASLGSGSGGNALVVEVRDGACVTCVLVDCGLNLRDTERRLARLGLEPSAIRGILVTHEHGDHAGRVFDFAAAHGVTVHLTYGSLVALEAEGKVIDGVRLSLLTAREPLAVEGIEVRPFTVPHDAREPLQLTCTDGAVRLGLLTDLGHVSAHVQQHLADCATLLLECNHDEDMLRDGPYPPFLKRRVGGGWGHLANTAAAALAQSLVLGGRLRRIVAAHLSEQNNTPELARAALDNAVGSAAEIHVADGRSGSGWLIA